jgi:NADH-quinone oxidoreductase subunit J
MEPVLFWTFAGIAVASALTAITRRNPISSALALAVTLFAVAGLFAMLSAHLLFILQILVYAGAVIVLIIFVIMLLNLGPADLQEMRLSPRKFALAAVACTIACGLTLRALAGLRMTTPPAPPDFGTAQAVSQVLFTRMLFPFEIVGLILLVGILGAVALAKRGE